MECYCRLQERYTVEQQSFVLVILRYSNCFTVNLSLLPGDIGPDAARYESSTHAEADIDENEQEQLHADCQYSQHRAADDLRDQVDCIRETVPDPDTTPFEQRRYGGSVRITGRRGATFPEGFDSVSPDPNRFDDGVSKPGLVPEGPETRRAKRTYLTDAEIAI